MRKFDESSLPRLCSECIRAPCVCRKSQPTRSDQILTQTIQPGVFEKSDFSEPINANIGISMQKQFDEMRITKSNEYGGSVEYAAIPTPIYDYAFYDGRIENFQDPPVSTTTGPEQSSSSLDYLLRKSNNSNELKIIDNYQQPLSIETFQSESNVYDPRFSGYGADDRGYLEPVTGQPRWFYDDINAVTRPNFVARNKIDVFPWAAQYGSGMNGNLSDGGITSGDGYKQLANNAYLDATLQFRTEMQERLMRKRNAEMWQRRVAPISTMSNSGKF
jgi:hypothetical protein